MARFARAIVYDRSGLGRSPTDPVGRTMERMTEDLLDVLDHFAPGPFILVGHSLGGPIVRLAAARRPDLIRGLVLVEPVDEDAASLFRPSFRRGFRIMLRVGRVLAHLGLFRAMFGSLLKAAPAEDVRRDMRAEAFAPSVLTTQLQRGRTFLDELKVWQTSAPDPGATALTVISGAQARSRDGMGEKVRAEAIMVHRQRAAAYHGKHVLAEQSGHYVPVTEPELIADEVAEMSRAVVQT